MNSWAISIAASPREASDFFNARTRNAARKFSSLFPARAAVGARPAWAERWPRRQQIGSITFCRCKHSVLGFYRRTMRDLHLVGKGQSGAITVLQRVDSDSRLNPPSSSDRLRWRLRRERTRRGTSSGSSSVTAWSKGTSRSVSPTTALPNASRRSPRSPPLPSPATLPQGPNTGSVPPSPTTRRARSADALSRRRARADQ